MGELDNNIDGINEVAVSAEKADEIISNEDIEKAQADVDDLEAVEDDSYDVDESEMEPDGKHLDELEKPKYSQEDLDGLERIDNFRPSAIDHIFNGEINSRGHATGYHYEGIEDSPGKSIEGTKTELDENGVYKATVEVDGVLKVGNGGASSFYPEDMSPQEVIDSINEAYDSRVHLRGNTYIGEVNGKFDVEMYLDDDEKIISAFPIYEGDE